MHCTSRPWEEAWYFHDIINMIFRHVLRVLQALYIACVLLLYILSSVIHELNRAKVSVLMYYFQAFIVVSFPARILVHSMYWCQLACILWRCRHRYPGSASCTSLIQLSTPESVVSLLAFRRTRLFCVSSFILLGCCGDCPNIHLSMLEAS